MTLTKAQDIARDYARSCFHELCAITPDDWPKELEARYHAAYSVCIEQGLPSGEVIEVES